MKKKLLEEKRKLVSRKAVGYPERRDKYELNPSLEIIDEPDGGFTVIWKHPLSKKVVAKKASEENILALKICSEDISLKDAAEETGQDTGFINRAMVNAIDEGLITGPRSFIRRSPGFMKYVSGVPDEYLSADVFTLQWHITHMCDLACRHCYDRTKRGCLPMDKSLAVLEDLEKFCAEKMVRGHVCFSGGNPFLHPRFYDIYGAAAAKGFSTSILGNPVSAEKIRKIIQKQMPGYFQVSLEGLEEHNDMIRGKGSFRRVMGFLAELKELGVSSAVMLTLTKDNMSQVIPLAELLMGRTDHFTFNRLSPVGEGACLSLPCKEEYAGFLSEYIKTSRSNPVMGYKDNLINVIFDENEESFFGGCTGYGCGAAFNFLTLLPDGEVHACRKFPSPVGNVNGDTLSDIYDSYEAGRYREGSKGCYSCGIKHICGGCLASTSGRGMDIFKEKDPFCFIKPH